MKLRPGTFFIAVILFSIVSSGLLGIFFFLLTLFAFEEGSIGPGIFVLLFSIFLLFLAWFFWRVFKDRFQFISIDKNLFRINRPLINSQFEISIGRIKGYSISLDHTYYGGPIRLKKNIITIYFRDDLVPVEIAQYQLGRVKEFEEALKNHGITFFGDEDIYRDEYGRRTKFKYQ